MPTRRAALLPATLAAVLLVPLLVGTATVHAGEADDRLGLTVTPVEAPAGSDVAVRGEGCGTGTRQVEVALSDLGSDRATGEVTADGTGAWEATLPVPPEMLQGDYAVVATCSGEEIYATTPFRVLPASGSLNISDDDGSDNTTMLILGALGALLLIGGGVMVFVTQRRPAGDTPDGDGDVRE